MADRKICVRCGRPIDAYARACPFCNWDQSEVPPASVETPTTQPAYVPPSANRWRSKIIAAIAFVALVVIAFVIGTFIHGFDASEVKAAQTRSGATSGHSTASPPPPHNIVTLVPVTDNNALPSVEQPITSAPPQAPGQQSSDATALPADEYAAAAARAKAQKKAASPSLDPRTITGTSHESPPPRRAERQTPPTQTESTQPQPPPEPRRVVARTEPVPEYQPVPEIRVDRETTARLVLTIGPDGRVKDIDIANAIPGETSKLIQAVQSWRFKPATENGIPVSARFSVDITIHANE
jgi:protein TonB